MPGKGRGLRTLTGTLFQIAFLPIQFLSKLLSSSNSGRGVVTLMVAVKADVRLLLRGTTGMGRQLWAESSLILWGAMLCRNPLWNCALFSLDNLDWDPVPIKIEETSFSWVEAKERTVSSVTCSLERLMLSSLERLFRWLGFYWCVLLSHDFHLQITPTGE